MRRHYVISITMGPVFLIHLFMCLMKVLFFKFPYDMFVLYSESNCEWILWKFGFPKCPPLPPSKDNQKQICFCYLFVLLCFVFQSGHIVLEGRQEIVSPIGSLTWDIKAKPQINLSKDHWIISFFTMFRDIIKIMPYQIVNPPWKPHIMFVTMEINLPSGENYQCWARHSHFESWGVPNTFSINYSKW